MSKTTHRQFVLAKTLRHNSTKSETTLWAKLRELNSGKLNFRRQTPIGDYIVDFVSFDMHLIIEVDGSQHNEPFAMSLDQKRSSWLESQGFRIIRFWNNDIISNIDGVINKILENV